MVNFFLDGLALEVAEGTTIFEAATRAGVAIPHFCYHPAFAPEGSCRMCLVEIECLPKLELSCSTVVREGQKVWTKSERVTEARRSVLEFLLAEHPLDCPICDKAGECRLQDYFQDHGLYPAAFDEFKERKDKKVSIGKSLVLDRERCVLCTRCVRFLEGVTKTRELGVFERGLRAEVGIYEDAPVNNNYSGCLAEICPVGAITDRDFRFKTRTWFLEQGASICPRCGRGCNIIIEHHPGFPRVPGSRKVYRLKAKPNPEVNGHWICDVGRYAYADLDSGRQEQITVKDEGAVGGRSWDSVTRFMAAKLDDLVSRGETGRVAVLASSGLSNEELFLIRRIFVDALKIHKVFLIDPEDGTPDGHLLTAERTPNRRGAFELGLKSGLPDLAGLRGGVDLLLMFSPLLVERFGLPEAKAFLASVGTKVLMTSGPGPLNEEVDIVLPAAAWAEKSGSFTNIDGLVQPFAPVREAYGQSLGEWEVLLRLAKDLRLSPETVEAINGVDDIRALLAREILFFRPRS